MLSPTTLLLGTALTGISLAANSTSCPATRPNIVFIFTDDQDLHLNSLEYMPSVQSHLIQNGTIFTNHFATISNCCPSRASLLRGQHGHNTNITHVTAPGGSYQKWRLSAEDDAYLPVWLGMLDTEQNANIGKFLNGYNRALYQDYPKGWSRVDALVDPYVYEFNTPVFSKDGETPILYHGYHQTDVLRAKAISRLQYLTEGQDLPFYLTIAPVAPHLQISSGLPVPLARHNESYTDLTAPQDKSFNPNQSYTDQKPSWLKDLTELTSTQITRINLHYRRRIQALQGIDEIVHDIVELLDEKGVLNNTYIIFSSDNGYHLGQHRVGAGKTLPYIADTNVPFIVRGPNVPHNKTSRLPGAHLDLAPTFLDIACVDSSDLPVFLDGRSLLDDWHNPDNSTGSSHRDIIHTEFWGPSVAELPSQSSNANNSYKALRIVGESSGYMYTKWCTGDSELYNTLDDPYELTNLALASNNPSNHTRRLIHRLNALLLVTKSCERDNCRNPWTVLQSSCEDGDNCPSGSIFQSLDTAMASKYDIFFESLPSVQFKECLKVQVAANEEPFLPESSRSLGGSYRTHVDYYTDPGLSNAADVPANAMKQGTWAQRYTNLTVMELKARNLTAAELGTG